MLMGLRNPHLMSEEMTMEHIVPGESVCLPANDQGCGVPSCVDDIMPVTSLVIFVSDAVDLKR